MGPSGRFTHVLIYWIVWDRFIQVFDELKSHLFLVHFSA